MKQSKSSTSRFTQYNRSLEGRYRSLKRAAKARGLRMSLSFKDFIKVADADCYYCGRKTTYKVTGYSLDRLVNSKGYTKNNVVPCCKHCNLIKGDNLTEYEMLVVSEILDIIRHGN